MSFSKNVDSLADFLSEFDLFSLLFFSYIWLTYTLCQTSERNPNSMGLSYKFYQNYSQSIMIQNKQTHQCLFTFNPDKFHQCLSSERKKKFPFLDIRKTKKLSAYQKIKTQQRQLRKKSQQEEQKINYNERTCIKNQNQKRAIQTQENQRIMNQKIYDPEKFRANKVTLPAVFRANSLINKKLKDKKRSISSHPEKECQNQMEKNINTIYTNRYSVQFPKQQIPQSGLKKYVSLEYNYEDNLLSDKGKLLSGQMIRKKNSMAVNINGIDVKVLEGICQMKKIYN